MRDFHEYSSGFSYVLDSDLRILVVDDDHIQREFSCVYLSAPNVEVVAAASGKEALTLLRDSKFDVALIDFDMPGINGVELIESIRANPVLAGLPIIMVTGYEDILTIDSAFHAGATSFVTKPVNWRLLSYQIKFVLNDPASRSAA